MTGSPKDCQSSSLIGCSAALEVDPGFQGKNFNVSAQCDLPWDLQPRSWRTAEDHPHLWLSCSSGEVLVQPTESAGRRCQPLYGSTKSLGCHPLFRSTQQGLPQRVSTCPTGWQHPYPPSKHDVNVSVCPKSCSSLSPTGPHNAGAQNSYQADKHHCKLSLKK